MCGIAGIVQDHSNGAVNNVVVHQMCEAIVHRGPDDEGIFVKGGVGLGMRRLSIIDLAGGHQPVFNEDRSVWIVFNGEIYNFLELRPELEHRGHRFSTHTDTEVIVHLYEEYGSECVQKLRGMFAFALYDERAGRLLLVRDRLGKKPLHYAVRDNTLLFASEIKAILAVRPDLGKVNHEALLQYMYFGYVPDSATVFETIQKLPPGHLLEFEKGKVHIRQYWDLPEYGTYDPNSEEELLDEMEQRLAEAVRIRLIADVPLGAMLSGGTDSSTIVALMSRANSQPVKTFSIGFRHADFNEAPYARLVAQKFGTDHHELIVEPDLVDTVTYLTNHLEEPFADSSMLPTYFICCLARKYVKVVLSGDGGDEGFAGYDRYRIYLEDRSHDWIPLRARRWYRENVHPRIPYAMLGRNRAYSISLPWQERYMERISFQSFQREMGILTDEFVAANGAPLTLFRKYLDSAPARDPLSRILYLDTKTYLPGDILTKVDRMSMATSLEARVPMLDHVFLEWVTGLAPRWKMRNGSQKFILRKLAERVGVPREVLNRPKQGFALPLGHWMRNELKDLVRTVLLEPRTLQRGYFKPNGVRLMLEEHFNQRRDHSARLWRLLVFELWHRNFLERIGSTSERPSDPVAALSGGAG
ncbi:MAG TPA: asparagine synthase (glutamine-hydrolyzing) [Candidatus Sulfotelmatobacter sp.]|nr:asparagine synthase (glutamine-hydrolyzing) [Candidatus Sulfotelmatobacter sp.]